MNLHPDLSFVAMVAHASFVVQTILVLLLLLSLWSWWQIFLKLFALRGAASSTDSFEDEFWKGGDLTALYQRASQAREGGALERIFSAGFREYSKHRKQGSSSAATMDSARRAMRASYQREIDLLEWSSFRWDFGMIRIEPTEYFLPKTEDSIGDVPVDPEFVTRIGASKLSV